MILLVKFKILTRQSLINNRKYAIIIIFTISAILTPPDVVSQILLAIPLMFMYEISIILTKDKLQKQAKINNKKIIKKFSIKNLHFDLHFFKRHKK